MVVMKFGGTSIIDASRMQHVSSLVEKSYKKEKTIVVLSAMKGTTESLLESADIAASTHGHDSGEIATNFAGASGLSGLGESNAQDKSRLTEVFEHIRQRHHNAWNELVRDYKKAEIRDDADVVEPDVPNVGAQSTKTSLPQSITHTIAELEEILHGILLIQECTPRTKDLILSFGERLSCDIFSQFLNMRKGISAQYVDARDFILTNEQYGAAGVFFEETYSRLNAHLSELLAQNIIPIVTGFIGATREGVTTTLGRNGSDYSAVLVGVAMGADRIEIWTDVDGVLSADPRIEPDAFVLPQVSYKEAMELSYFGAKVIHPQAVVPAVDLNIPILIKNTLNPEVKGTIIHNKQDDTEASVRGLASVKDVSVLTIEGAGLSGNFYFLPDVFGVFAMHHVQPLMITQSSSEHSISFVLNHSDAPRMRVLLEQKFKDELMQKKIQDISVIDDKSIISVIGSNMRGIAGLSGKIFSAMGDAGINVFLIAQGSNEMNVSFVVEKKKEQDAIKVLHRKFFVK